MSITNEIKQIFLENIVLRYEQEIVLDNISFSIEKGDYVGIIGPNGSGKTSLLKLILGLLKPDSGTIKIFGADPRKLKERYKIGYVPQNISYIDKTFPATVEEVVRSGRTAQLGIGNLPEPTDHEAIETALINAEIKHLRKRLFGTLSGGERQRTLIARALAARPEMLILDEPEAGIDLVTQQNFYRFINTLNKEMGITILLVSHNVDAVANEVRTIVCLNHKLVCHGSIKDFVKEEYIEQLHNSAKQFIEHKHKT